MRRVLFLLTFAVIGTHAALCAKDGAKAAAPTEAQADGPIPLQVDLMQELDTGKLRTEVPVFVKVQKDWNGPGCLLREGAVIAGHVSRVDRNSKEKPGSSITLNFDRLECEGHRSDLKLVIVAVVAEPWVNYGRSLIESTNHTVKVDAGSSATAGVVLNMDGSRSFGFGVGDGGIALAHPTFDVSNERTKMPSSVKPGDVVGTKKIKLGVEKGADGNSILVAEKGNIDLQMSSQLVLLPKEALHPEAGRMVAKTKMPQPDSAGGPTVAGNTPAVEEVDETSICNAPCTLIPEKDEPMPTKAALTLAVAKLGYTPRDLALSSNNANYESTLSYLDENNLLFTYDPHDLRHRYPSGYSTESMHRVRAVLLNRADLSVKRMVDWQIQGEGQYLWHLGNDGLLVHVGHSLRLFGPDLTLIREIAIPGEVVFVSTSPSGDHIAVGTVSELHSQAIHQQLTESFGTEPDEGVDVQIFDRNFKLLFVAHEDSARYRAPILSDAGEIRLQYAGKSHWIIQEIRWDHTEHTIANVISHCPVSVDTPRPDALFVVGCTTSAFSNWYRILRLDGHLILSGHAPGLDTQQCLSSPHGDYAVRMVIPKPALSRDLHLYKASLDHQQVSVYRSQDGKRLFSTASPGISLTQQSFAMSPEGDQLAVLSDTAISVYEVK